ncbi:MAG: histidine phosphatase family protein [Pseudomonadota bacterium]
MKTIILTRHAKSSWKSDASSDFERPLNKRGVTDVPVMAARLSELGPAPGLIVSSTAVRALQTAEMLMAEMSVPNDLLTTTNTIYEAPARVLIDLTKTLPADVGCAMMVGHNPGMSAACNYLSKDAHVEMSTLAMVCLDLDIENWDEVYPDCATVRWYEYPKKHTGLK